MNNIVRVRDKLSDLTVYRVNVPSYNTQEYMTESNHLSSIGRDELLQLAFAQWAGDTVNW